MSQIPVCPDCGWWPGDELRTTSTGRRPKLWPTEGARGCSWIEENLIQAKGDDYGQPIRLRGDQKLFLWRWYEFCGGCGFWRYEEAVRGAATGDGKTTLMAAVGDLEAFGPPQIAPVDANVVIAAASWDQANILFGMAGTMAGGRDQDVKEAPLCGLFEVYDSKILRADHQPGMVERVAAVAGTNEGGAPSLFICDEVHEWGDLGSNKARVHTVIGKSTKKRRLSCNIPEKDGIRQVKRGTGRILNLSTAGFDVENSLLGAMYTYGKQAEIDPARAPRLLFDWREAPDDLDYDVPADRRRAVEAASAAAGILWDVEARVREWEKPHVQHHEWIRYYANRWVDVADESWLAEHPAAWGKCKGSWVLAGDEDTVLAIDLSLSRDSTAVVEAVRLGDGRLAVTAKIWLPRKGVLVPHKDVSAYVLGRIAELGSRFRGVVYDPALMQQIAEDIEDAGVVPVEFSQQPSFMAPACAATFDLIITAGLVHDGDREFGLQVKGAVRRQQERGFTLSKGRSRRKIDAAVAMCMAVEGMLRLPPRVNWANTVW